MSVKRSVSIDAEITSIGQFDRTATWKGKLAVECLADGRVCIGSPTQAGFESITVSFADLQVAVRSLAEQEPER